MPKWDLGSLLEIKLIKAIFGVMNNYFQPANTWYDLIYIH